MNQKECPTAFFRGDDKGTAVTEDAVFEQNI
jgi:hypothetical protein